MLVETKVVGKKLAEQRDTIQMKYRQKPRMGIGFVLVGGRPRLDAFKLQFRFCIFLIKVLQC